MPYSVKNIVDGRFDIAKMHTEPAFIRVVHGKFALLRSTIARARAFP
jgi:hypothetical protein